MPARCSIDPRLPGLILTQDHVLHRDQALAAGLSQRAIGHRLSANQWQRLLPGVYLAAPTEPTRRQLLIAGTLYAGPGSAVDDVDACRYHGVRSIPVDECVVHVVTPWSEPARSKGFVVVRRTTSPIHTVAGARLRYVDAATAVVVAARGMRRERSVLALISDALQRRLVTHEELIRAHVQGPPRGAGRVSRVLEELWTGADSPTEVDVLALVALSSVLPTPLCNPLLRLPCGRLISPDMLLVGSAIIHETNGAVAHRRADLFADMQERHDVLTATGFTVLHNPPSRIHRQPREVLGELERCHLREDGRGLPPGVVIVRSGRPRTL
jgi:hypothetical protein